MTEAEKPYLPGLLHVYPETETTPRVRPAISLEYTNITYSFISRNGAELFWDRGISECLSECSVWFCSLLLLDVTHTGLMTLKDLLKLVFVEDSDTHEPVRAGWESDNFNFTCQCKPNGHPV